MPSLARMRLATTRSSIRAGSTGPPEAGGVCALNGVVSIAVNTRAMVAIAMKRARRIILFLLHFSAGYQEHTWTRTSGQTYSHQPLRFRFEPIVRRHLNRNDR